MLDGLREPVRLAAGLTADNTSMPKRNNARSPRWQICRTLARLAREAVTRGGTKLVAGGQKCRRFHSASEHVLDSDRSHCRS